MIARTSRMLMLVWAAQLVSILLATPALCAQYTAYSLKVARARIEQAGDEWRDKELEVLRLAGMNRVAGFVYDTESKDLILVGQREGGRAPVSLDDLVVALRARLRYNQWPLVSIDPTPETERTQTQHVRFEGGIQETAFGRAMYDADYRLKQMCMRLEEPGIEGLKTYWDRGVEEVKTGADPGEREINSRFWFYPTNPHVVVRQGVCVVRGVTVGVFTEVLAAKIDGKPVEDVKGFKLEKADAFASDVSARFEDLCRVQPSFNRLRGLQELVAVSKAVAELEERPELSWWLEKYPLSRATTPKEAEVLRRRFIGVRGWFDVCGGVCLTAMAMRLKAGDVRALRKAVTAVRPSADALSWSFIIAEWAIPIGRRQVKPEDVGQLFAEALFLQNQERYSDAVTAYDKILKLAPDHAEAYNNRGVAKYNEGKYDRAIQDLDKAIAINPNLAEAYLSRGIVYYKKRKYNRAIQDFDKAIAINPNLAEACYQRGIAYGLKGEYDRAIQDFDKAISINPEYGEAYYSRGVVYGKKGQYDRAIQDYDKAIAINPNLAEAYLNKAVACEGANRYKEAIEAYRKFIQVAPPQYESYVRQAQEKIRELESK